MHTTESLGKILKNSDLKEDDYDILVGALIRNFMHRYYYKRSFETYFRTNPENGDIEILIYLTETGVKLKGAFKFSEIEKLYLDRYLESSVKNMVSLANSRFENVDPEEQSTKALVKEGFEAFKLPDLPTAA